MAKQRILLIDHRPEQLSQPVLRLQLEGYDVESASSGEDGLRMLREGEFDLVLLDAELKSNDGWDTLRRIRDDPDLEGVKVIVFMAGSGETGKLALVPVDGELRRPFQIGELLDKVRKVLED